MPKNTARRSADALPLLDRALALDPRDPGRSVYLQYQCRAYLVLGRYDDAIASCEKSIALESWWLRYLFLVAAYAQKGDYEKSAAAKAELMRLYPGLTIASHRRHEVTNVPLALEQTETHFYAGLRKAGIPEQ